MTCPDHDSTRNMLTVHKDLLEMIKNVRKLMKKHDFSLCIALQSQSVVRILKHKSIENTQKKNADVNRSGM